MKKLFFSLIMVLLFVSTALAKVNINTADAKELETLNGIGPAKAAAIIKYREENGEFKSVDDLTKVSGIGDKILQQIRDEVELGATITATSTAGAPAETATGQ